MYKNNPIAVASLERCNAYAVGHFVLTPKEVPPGSGNWVNFHANSYVNKDEAYWTPTELKILAHEIALQYVGQRVDVVVGPEKGAISLATLVALELADLQDSSLLPPSGCVHACWAEKVGAEEMVIGRVFGPHIKGMPDCKVLVVEDIGVSASSARKTILAAQKLGAEVIGVAFITLRTEVTEADLAGVKETCLLFVPIDKWLEEPGPDGEPCPMCQQDGFESVSLTIGKGKEFLIRKGILALA